MKVLLIEDDKVLCDAMAAQLEKEHYETQCCYTGEDAFYYVEQGIYDIIILDRMLPGLDGLTIMEKIRKKKYMVPVIMVTAMNGIYDRVDGLDAGADDYLAKPFAMEELLARMRALLRRPRVTGNTETVSFGDLELDMWDRKLRCREKKMTLSKREGDLLEFFMRNSCQTISREQILLRVWGIESDVEDGNVDNYVHLVRRRLKSIGSNARIKTVYGIGYRLEGTEE